MQPIPQNQSDHDLLVVLNERVANVVEEMRLLRDDSSTRLKRVEDSKLDKIEFEKYLIQETKKEEELLRNISFLTKTVYIGIGGLAVIEFVLQFILPFVFNHYK